MWFLVEHKKYYLNHVWFTEIHIICQNSAKDGKTFKLGYCITHKMIDKLQSKLYTNRKMKGSESLTASNNFNECWYTVNKCLLHVTQEVCSSFDTWNIPFSIKESNMHLSRLRNVVWPILLPGYALYLWVNSSCLDWISHHFREIFLLVDLKYYHSFSLFFLPDVSL